MGYLTRTPTPNEPDEHPDEKRTPAEWCEIFDAEVIDPDGWRGNYAQAWDVPITAQDFARRWMHSTCRQPPGDDLLRLVQEIEGIPCGGDATEGGDVQ